MSQLSPLNLEERIVYHETEESFLEAVKHAITYKWSQDLNLRTLHLFKRGISQEKRFDNFYSEAAKSGLIIEHSFYNPFDRTQFSFRPSHYGFFTDLDKHKYSVICSNYYREYYIAENNIQNKLFNLFNNPVMKAAPIYRIIHDFYIEECGTPLHLDVASDSAKEFFPFNNCFTLLEYCNDYENQSFMFNTKEVKIEDGDIAFFCSEMPHGAVVHEDTIARKLINWQVGIDYKTDKVTFF